MLSCRVGSATAWLRQFSSSASTSLLLISYVYKKVNMNGINQHLDKENINVFTNYSKTNSIQECWGEFKEILSQAITTYIPTKMLTSRWKSSNELLKSTMVYNNTYNHAYKHIK
jgi:hemerythrin-like domain-containing protein